MSDSVERELVTLIHKVLDNYEKELEDQREFVQQARRALDSLEPESEGSLPEPGDKS